MQDDRAIPTRRRHDSGLSTPATFLVALLALAAVVGGLHFLPAQSGTPAYAEGPTPTAEPTPYLEPVPNPPDPPLTNTSKLTAAEVRYVEDWLFYYVNQERIRRGIDPLVRHDGLDLIARNRSYDMGVRGYFSHYDPDGGFANKNEFEKADYDACHKYGENISAREYGKNSSDSDTPKTKGQIARDITRGLMYSTPHRRAILDVEYEVIGFGIYAEEGQLYSTMVFCDTGTVHGSRYYEKRVEPAVRHPEWLPKETREVIQYDYDTDGTEKAITPPWLENTDTLTPIGNQTRDTE